MSGPQGSRRIVAFIDWRRYCILDSAAEFSERRSRNGSGSPINPFSCSREYIKFGSIAIGKLIARACDRVQTTVLVISPTYVRRPDPAVGGLIRASEGNDKIISVKHSVCHGGPRQTFVSRNCLERDSQRTSVSSSLTHIDMLTREGLLSITGQHCNKCGRHRSRKSFRDRISSLGSTLCRVKHSRSWVMRRF